MSGSSADRLVRWNARFTRGEEIHAHRPDPLLARAIEGMAPGFALDVACGAGRHAIALAERGFRVVAVDGSDVAIDLLRAEARRRGCAERIETRVVDLEADPPSWSPAPVAYDLVVDAYFLHRPSLPVLGQAVRPGGRFAAAIHVESPEGARPHRFVLAPGELAEIVSGWGFAILHAEEGPAGAGPGWVARIVAQRP